MSCTPVTHSQQTTGPQLAYILLRDEQVKPNLWAFFFWRGGGCICKSNQINLIQEVDKRLLCQTVHKVMRHRACTQKPALNHTSKHTLMTVCTQEITWLLTAMNHQGLADHANSPVLLTFNKTAHTHKTGGHTYYLVESESWYSLRRS